MKGQGTAESLQHELEPSYSCFDFLPTSISAVAFSLAALMALSPTPLAPPITSSTADPVPAGQHRRIDGVPQAPHVALEARVRGQVLLQARHGLTQALGQLLLRGSSGPDERRLGARGTPELERLGHGREYLFFLRMGQGGAVEGGPGWSPGVAVSRVPWARCVVRRADTSRSA